MTDRTQTFDLKLLTSSKEVGLRRLRTYAAALGGGAQIFNTYEDLRRNMESTFCGHRNNVVLHDDTVPLTSAQMLELQRFGRVFVIQPQSPAMRGGVPAPAAPCWQVESYLQCSLAAFLDSPIVRMSMAQMCKLNQPFHLEHLLRWGHAAQTWDLSGKTSIADAGLRFVRNLNLAGEGRRLTEMFSHFIQVRLPALKLKKQAVTFGADGLLITVIVRCTPEPGMHVRDAAEELRIHDFPISVVNRLGDGSFEIGALHYPFQTGADASERIVMVFNKSQDAATEEHSVDPLPPVNKAG